MQALCEVLAPETLFTATGNMEGVFTGTVGREQFADIHRNAHTDYDTSKGMWVKDAEGNIRMTVEEIVPGRIVKVLVLGTPEELR